jgi:cell wall assembly regulator SMI1
MEFTLGVNSDESIRELESLLNCSFPEDYRTFLKQTNGGRPKKAEFQHPEFGISIINYYLTASKVKNFRTIIQCTESLGSIFSDDTMSRYVVIATDPGGLDICIGVAKDNLGQIFVWDHDTPNETIEFLKIANSFSEFFDSCFETNEEAEAAYVSALKISK